MTGSARRRKAEQEATLYMHAVDAGVALAFGSTDAKPVTGDALTDALGSYVAAAVRRRLRGAEKSSGPPAMHYAGTWSAGTAYAPGQVATFGGTIWHCEAQTTSKPGTDSTWKLMAKSR